MFCTKCGKLLPEEAVFCTECGTPAEKPSLESAPPVDTAADTAEKTEKSVPDDSAHTGGPLVRDAKSEEKSPGNVSLVITLKKRDIYIMVVLVLVAFFLLMFYKDSRQTGSGGVTENELFVRQTIETFNNEFNRELDFKSYVNGYNLSFAPLSKYFDDSASFKWVNDVEELCNLQFGMFRYLYLEDDISQYILDGTIRDVPVFGASLQALTKTEIENDPLFDNALWESVARISFIPTSIIIDKNGDRAAVTMSVEFDADMSGFDESKIQTPLGGDFSEMSVDAGIIINAQMERQQSGVWIFTSFEKL